jgi:hypothetical protein
VNNRNNVSGNHDRVSGNRNNVSGNHNRVSGNRNRISGNHKGCPYRVFLTKR